jgi:hypothetical protein
VNEQLAALFAQHKTAILTAGAAGVAGLALLTRRRKTAAAGAAGSPAGTIPAAGVVPSSGVQGVYPDTSATDVYNQLEGQLERLQASQAIPVPKPVASTLFAPSNSGQVVAYSDGIYERETDNSLLHLSGPQAQAILDANGGKYPNLVTFTGNAPGGSAKYGTAENLQAALSKAAGA